MIFSNCPTSNYLGKISFQVFGDLRKPSGESLQSSDDLDDRE